MNVNFAEALRLLGPDAAFRIANAARPEASYLFASLLPEQNKDTYDINSANMTVRTTMAGLVGEDSVYPPGGMIEWSNFIEQTAKFAIETKLTERVLRQIMALLQRVQMSGGNTTQAAQQEALNFLNKVIIQAHMDAMEYTRGKALVAGAIDYTNNQIRLQVNYGVPAGNFLANRTGTAAYYNTASVFWADLRTVRKILKNSLRIAIMHPDTMNDIVYNDANKGRVVAQGEGFVELQRYVGTTEQPTGDARDTIRLVSYDLEVEIMNVGSPGTTTKIPVMPRGKILYIGTNQRSGYRVGEGSTEDPNRENNLGYTHIAPTIEGGGRPGRWAQLYVPENAPWSLHGRGVTNGLPVIEAPDKIVVASTDMAP